MKRNQVARKALVEYCDKSFITDIDDFSEALWRSIAASTCKQYSLEIISNDESSLEFIVKLLIKIGFSSEDSVRLMMRIHKNGSIILAKAEEDTLLRLQKYINIQAKAHACQLENRIIRTL
ncbi:ATP-dependent Clp protease adaptor ClpS [Alkalimarinus alittae]|uniref:ATP-dependent Clp protease adaptor ClpS n=1 Tax=Alkalimarinus alittae TaxID=2961619 RepID=A0ABY6N6A0_9ALTE|nr:ATP-dependent Clp protease adaptor ClpS [Alkalimarinus alittae]UZE97647.1 ATP-dependent Clp protease adaptor ClpS [Alkalimarinus alittae]